MSTSRREQVAEGQDVVCGRCQQSNPVARRFCAHCGSRLWEPCAECGTPSGIDLVYCGNCGTALQAAYEQRLAEVATRLRQSDELRSEGRYFEAIAALNGFSAKGDTRLEPYVQELQERQAALTAERTTHLERAEGLATMAQRAIEQSDFQAAHHLLSQIPPGIRDPSTKQLLKTASDRLEEVAGLTAEVRQAVQSRQLDGILSRVTRLLELCPHDAKLLHLAEQLRQRERQSQAKSAEQAVAVAKQQYVQGKYAAAARTIAELTDDSCGPALRTAVDTIREVDWLVQTLKREPFAVSGLQVVADRWLKLRPQDADAMRLADEVRKRLALPAARGAMAARWAKLPAATQLAVPLEYWRMPSKSAEASADRALQQSPGRFLAAYGLALQGLGQAALNTNLNPQRSAGFLSRLKQLNRPAPVQSAWGLDLGLSGLKALQLRRDSDGQLEIATAHFVGHDAAIFDAATPEAVDAILRQTLARFAEQAEPEQAAAVVGFACPRSLGRWFDIPQLKGQKVRDAIAYEARLQIPIPLEEIVFDYHVWPSSTATSALQHVTLLAARRDHVQRHVSLFADLPLQIVAVQSVGLALYNAAAAEFWSGPAQAPTVATDQATPRPTLGLLELGVESSNLVIVSPTSARFRSIGIGTARVDRALMNHFQLTRGQTQELRHHPASAKWLHRLDQELQNTVWELGSELRRTLQNYETEGIQLQKCLVLGGAAEQLGLLRHLVHGQ